MAEQRTVGRLTTFDLVGRLINTASTLLDKQVHLAKAEAVENVKEALRGGVLLAIGGVVALNAMVCLVVAGILALSLVVPGWVAGLIGFAFFAIVGTIVLLIGKAEIEAVTKHPLQRTKETLREDVEWARHRLSSNEK